MHKFLSSLSLAICLLAPAGALYAQDHHDDAPKHQWSDNENPAWHQYLKENHRKDHDWSKATKREQTNYWKWRDQHHDK